MTPDELRAARRALGLTGAELAELMGFASRTLRVWEGRDAKQTAPIPRAVEIIVNLALKYPIVRRELGIKGRP
jgi:DNA-binding transcriptional regulator YiaG